MGGAWASASRCRDTLKLMLDQLTSESGSLPNNTTQVSASIPDETRSSLSLDSEASIGTAEEVQNKRRKYNHTATQPPVYPSTEPALLPGLDASYMWQPVLEYTGPDFGFDTNQFCRQGAWQEFLEQGLNPGLSGVLFDNAGWDSYVKIFGDRLS